VPNLGDARAIDWSRVEPVDVVVTGFPCQDISAAGRRAGIEKGTRSGLRTDIVAGLRVLRPALVVVENVAALRWKSGGLHRVLGDLAETGYDALWRSVRAADIGAAHRRERVFLLAWPRRARPGDVADTDRTRRLLQRHQRQRPPRRPDPAGPTTAAADTDRVGREDLHAPHPDRWPVTVRRGSAAAHPTRDGRHQGRTGPAWLEGRPDAPLRDHPAGLATREGRRVAPESWGPYAEAIHRWEAVVGRPAPCPTQPGEHGRPVLAPRFVEHLMGLPRGWVTDLPLPRTGQLRALGNGVVPQQASHAVDLLLDDLADLFDIARSPALEPEVAA
jgi:DNA (cytosine-5)-methyltransferase 1